mgnify:CR=1 FL=1
MFRVQKRHSLGVYDPRTTPWEFTVVNPMVYGRKLLDTPYTSILRSLAHSYMFLGEGIRLNRGFRA